ncbi:MAG: SCO family protein [Bacteroidota bacterium]
MQKIAQISLLSGLLCLPVVLTVGLSFAGVGHPLKGEVLQNTSFLDESNHTTEVVFFGYAGCSYVCPTALFRLNELVESIHAEDSGVSLGITFVDVNAYQQLGTAQQYGAQFSDHIRGINLSGAELEKTREQFRLSVTGRADTKQGIIHTDHFFVLTRSDKRQDWQIQHILAQSTSDEEIKHILITAVKPPNIPS